VRDSERLAWLRLARTENVGPVTFAMLIARFGTAQAALEAVPAMAARGGKKSFVLPPESEIACEFAALEKMGGRFLLSCDPQFPHGLAALDPPPPAIAVLGHAHLLARDMVAIVGARNASALGRRLAWTLARDLGEAGLAIVSGMARGIDAAAHEAALETGTVAVVAGGIDIVYPPENQALYDALRERGALVSEMRLGEAPQARHFPRRNRLISGLSRGVVVVEAAERSGSLITAQFALEQGREIFAVPGSPLDPRARGCNRLLREGATLTESAADVMGVLRPILGADFREPGGGAPPAPPAAGWEAEADKVRAKVEEALGPAPVAVDELIRQIQAATGAPPQAVLTVLLELELAGRCARHPGNLVSWS
jgi:DNA processing protein